jgi:chorismate mutase/prephenate dehydratase
LIIGNSILSQSGNDKTSLLIKPPNTDDSGSLYKLLEYFVKNDINLNRIESRPSKTKNWNYVFFIDIDGHLTDKNINKTLENLKDNNIEVKFLGSYPKSK